MIATDLHTHTRYSDGENTPEEMIQAAIRLDMDCIGFSDHSYTPFDEGYCMSPEATKAYKEEISELRQKYRDQIRVCLGVEQDYYSPEGVSGYEYVIGSVHYIKLGGLYVSVDDGKETFIKNVEDYFGGDYIAFSELYYATVADVVRQTHADIIGHFDLVSKYNGDNELFNEQDPRYVLSWQKAVDELIHTEKPFEINTSQIAKGRKDHPYPSPDIIEYIQKKSGHFVLSSDSHSTRTLCYGFSDYEHLVSEY